jgi:hypothetical protein
MMRLMPRLWVFLWCCGLLLARAVPAGAAATERDVHTAATLEMMKGHLIAAVENATRRQTPLAPRLPAEERPRLQALWAALEDAIPGVMPPASAVSAKAVEEHVSAITAVLRRLR